MKEFIIAATVCLIMIFIFSQIFHKDIMFFSPTLRERVARLEVKIQYLEEKK